MSEPITHRTFVSYIDRTREFYAAQGYERPYCWAQFDDSVPFTTAPRRALSSSSASRLHHDGEPRPAQPEGVGRRACAAAKEVWSGSHRRSARVASSPTTSPGTRNATHTNDVESFLPIRKLHATGAPRRGRTDRQPGSALSSAFPTDYSQRRTRGARRAGDPGDAVAKTSADVALLVPLVTGLSPDRESGRPAPGRERHPHRRHRLRPRHRRGVRRSTLPVHGLPAR